MLALALLLSVVHSSNPLAWMNDVNRNFDDLDHYANFENWAARFDKVYYNADEENHRFLLFVDNWRMINEHNMETHNYTMGNNQFSDMTQEEFLYYVHGHAESCLKQRDDAKYPTDKPQQNDQQELISVAAPNSIDWTNINGTTYVTPVKDQSFVNAYIICTTYIIIISYIYNRKLWFMLGILDCWIIRIICSN